VRSESECKSAFDPLWLERSQKDVNPEFRKLLYRYFHYHREQMNQFLANKTNLLEDHSRRIRFLVEGSSSGTLMKRSNVHCLRCNDTLINDIHTRVQVSEIKCWVSPRHSCLQCFRGGW
jgi:hypothetical protein